MALAVGCSQLHTSPPPAASPRCSIHLVQVELPDIHEGFAGTAIALGASRFLTCQHVTGGDQSVITIDGVEARIVQSGKPLSEMTSANDRVREDWALLATSRPLKNVTVPAFWGDERLPAHAEVVAIGFHFSDIAGEPPTRSEFRTRLVADFTPSTDLLALEFVSGDHSGTSGGPIFCFDCEAGQWKVIGLIIGLVEGESRTGRKVADLIAGRRIPREFTTSAVSANP